MQSHVGFFDVTGRGQSNESVVYCGVRYPRQNVLVHVPLSKSNPLAPCRRSWPSSWLTLMRLTTSRSLGLYPSRRFRVLMESLFLLCSFTKFNSIERKQARYKSDQFRAT